MSTATKITVKATWPVSKIQAEAALAAATQCATATGIISKLGDQALADYKAAMRKNRVKHLKENGVKTPIDLITAMAEFETNVFGSEVEITGDDKSATMTYKSCAMWEAMQKVTSMTPEEQQKMGQSFQNCMQDLANEFGFTANCQMDENTCAITFNK